MIRGANLWVIRTPCVAHLETGGILVINNHVKDVKIRKR